MASALAAAMEQEKKKKREFSREASRVGGALLRDFHRSGMFLPSAAARKAAADAESAAAVASMRFTDALADPEAGGVRFKVSYSNSSVAATPAAVASALRFEPDPELRKRCFEAAFSRETTQHLTQPLHAMLESRSARAEALGFGRKGWRGMLIDDDGDDGDESGKGLASLAGDASTVRSFLLDLAKQLRPLAEEQVALLSAAKKRESGASKNEPLQPWDVSFFSAKIRAEAAAAAAAKASGGLLSSTSAAPATPMVPIACAIAGAIDILEAAVGVRLFRARLREGESWAPGGVAKFVAYDIRDDSIKGSKGLKGSKTDPSRVLGEV
jgi:Zn-dependent oligopeptidase